jgi:hypothetical protein
VFPGLQPREARPPYLGTRGSTPVQCGSHMPSVQGPRCWSAGSATQECRTHDAGVQARRRCKVECTLAGSSLHSTAPCLPLPCNLPHGRLHPFLRSNGPSDPQRWTSGCTTMESSPRYPGPSALPSWNLHSTVIDQAVDRDRSWGKRQWNRPSTRVEPSALCPGSHGAEVPRRRCDVTVSPPASFNRRPPMTRVRVDCFSISLDGYGEGPDQSEQKPLGVGSEQRHQWFVPPRSSERRKPRTMCWSGSAERRYHRRGEHAPS